jgi:hypothetical protein
LQRVDNTLVQEWESLLSPAASSDGAPSAAFDLAHDEKALRAWIRADLHLLVKALAERDYLEASSLVRTVDDDEAWTEERFERALESFYAEHERITFDQRARQTDKTIVRELAPRLYRVQQILVDEAEDNQWFVEAEVDARAALDRDLPLLRLVAIAGS